MNHPESVKSVMLTTLDNMAYQPDEFVKDPGHDFTRKRKLDFKDTVLFVFDTVIFPTFNS